VPKQQAQIEQPAPAEPQPSIAQESGPPQPAPVENTADATAPAAETAAVAPAAGQPAATAPAAPAAAPAEIPAADAQKQKGIIIKIKKNSWVEIRGKDGKSIVSRVLNAGDQYYVPDRPDLTISLGNSGGVELQVEGKTLKPLGNEGEVRRN